MSKQNLIHLDRERMKRRGDTRMTRPELIDELVFLLNSGTHPLLAAQMLGYEWGSLQKFAGELGRLGEIQVVDIEAWQKHASRGRSGWGYAA